MKIVAAVFADFVESPAGGASQLGTEINGRTILHRTLQRVGRIEELAARYLVVQPRDREPAEHALRLLDPTQPFELLCDDAVARSRRVLIQTARKWSLESWRGNPLGMTWFDEFVEPRAVAFVMSKTQAPAVFCFDGHQPVVDPQIASAMIRNLRDRWDECRQTFTQAPPGLAGIILRQEALVDLLKLEIPLGLMLSYRPELAQPDPITNPSCYHIDSTIAQTATRLTGDTLRSRELLADALHTLGDDASAQQLCHWVRSGGRDRAGSLPVEIELELTTADPLPETVLRPRGDRVPSRTPADPLAVRELGQQLARYDDRLVVLGGHGDPLQHAQFAAICQSLRVAGVYGLAVTTPLVDLTDEQFEAFFNVPVDVLEVQLDALNSGTYKQIHKRNAFEAVVSHIKRIEENRASRRSPRPIIVCSQTRHSTTLEDLETFHDYWIRAVGSAVVHGYNDYAGLLPADTLLPTCPPVREPCRRLPHRLMLLADGVVARCHQDVRGEAPLGNWVTEPLEQIWCGAALQALRAAHQRLQIEPLPLCPRCSEWFRP
jgi:hypothetical protein